MVQVHVGLQVSTDGKDLTYYLLVNGKFAVSCFPKISGIASIKDNHSTSHNNTVNHM